MSGKRHKGLFRRAVKAVLRYERPNARFSRNSIRDTRTTPEAVLPGSFWIDCLVLEFLHFGDLPVLGQILDIGPVPAAATVDAMNAEQLSLVGRVRPFDQRLRRG